MQNDGDRLRPLAVPRWSWGSGELTEKWDLPSHVLGGGPRNFTGKGPEVARARNGEGSTEEESDIRYGRKVGSINGRRLAPGIPNLGCGDGNDSGQTDRV